MEGLTSTAVGLVRLYGPLALCLFTFLETSMLFPFLPSEVVVPAAAALLVVDVPSFLVFVTAASAGGTAGAFVPFTVFHDTSAGELGWVRARVDVSEDRVERARAWFERWGQWSVLWGRFLPVLRSVISVPAAFADMERVRFGAFTAVGTAGFYAATGAVVYYGRRQPLVAAVVNAAAARPGLTAVAVVVLLGGVLLARAVRSRRRTPRE